MAHAPAWAAFNRQGAATGDVGIWHETYAVPAEQIESLYGNMPTSGLAAAVGWAHRASRARSRTVERMGHADPDDIPDSGASAPADQGTAFS